MAKISTIQPLGTWQNQQGKTVHSFNVALDNGLQGKVNAMSADRWNVGDTVEAESYNDKQNNPCLKLSKPDTGGGYSKGGKMDKNTEKRITFLSCLSSAASFHAQSSVTPEQVIETAKKFANAAYEVSTPPPAPAAPSTPPQSKVNNFVPQQDDLPF